MWLIMACLSAVFAGLTTVLAKCGVRKTDSDVATALRTVVVLAFSWVMVAVTGTYAPLGKLSARALAFLILSGLATGASWIFYFRALALGNVNQVVPVDKSSTVLSVLLAIVIFQETANLPVKLAGTALLALGIWLMVEKRPSRQKQAKHGWLLYAVGSAVFAALTSVLAKLGLRDVDSNLATAVRTGVVLLLSWAIVLARGKLPQIKRLDGGELGFLALSGLATGASWLCYYDAVQHGVLSVVVPIDKLSVLVTVGVSYVAFGERLSRRALVGLGLMTAGTLLMALFAA